ncbi:MAG: prepilin-type N-terminal cleavage/methylation domain-containing protein [Kiritimatiellia bacterium]
MKRGFTLIELLVVIVIIGILVSGVFMMMRAGGDKAGIAQTVTKVHAIATLLEEYKAQYGNYPIVTDRDGNGCAKLEFSFLCDPGSDATGSSPVVFGLFSHFIPRATTIDQEAEDSMRGYYERQFSNPEKGSIWESEYTAGSSMEKIARGEAADPRLALVNRAFRRLKKDGVVSAGSSVNIETGRETYHATASDSWGRALMYRMDGSNGEIVSYGPDGKYGTSDDITSAGMGNDEDED